VVSPVNVLVTYTNWPRVPGDGTFSFEEFVQVMANMGGLSEQSEEDEEKELRQAFTVSKHVVNAS